MNLIRTAYQCIWPTQTEDPLIPDKKIPNYTVTKEFISRGNYNVTYKALKETTEGPKELIVKIINTTHRPLDNIVNNAITIWKELDHNRILKIENIVPFKDSIYIFLNVTSSQTVFGFIQKNGRVNENQTEIWLRNIGCGLQFLHSRRIGHRNISCQYLLLSQNLEISISGLQYCIYSRNVEGEIILTGPYLGCIEYAGPEYQDRHDAMKMDIYNCGIAVYYMLTTGYPFPSFKVKTRILYQQREIWGWPDFVEISPKLKDLFKRMISLSPVDRPPADQLISEQS